jgi:Fe2+-dicitrate sensor, membrane component
MHGGIASKPVSISVYSLFPMSKDRIWLLVSKKLAGEANTGELMELEELLRHDPDMHYALQNISDLWNLPNQQSIETEEAFDRHTSRMKANGVAWPDHSAKTTGEPFLQRRSNNTLWFTGIATALLLIAGIIWWYPGAQQPTTNAVANKTTSEKNEIRTRNGSKTKITLPDGSKVWLNAGTKLVYIKEFGNKVREVELSGEAFFDVVHVTAPQNGEKIPFIIHTNQLDIRVLGTAFNVKSYPGESITETSLVRGKVEIVIHNRPEEKIILKPNEKLMVRNDEPAAKKEDSSLLPENKPPPLVLLSKLTPREDSLIVETAWVQNKLVFDNESFAEVAAKMERWYNVQFRFKEASLKKLRFSGVFESETIQQALDYMSITGPFHYSMQGNIIYIGK